VAQLERVAEQHEAIDPVQGPDEPRPRLGEAQDVLPAERAEVEVGDEERPQGRRC